MSLEIITQLSHKYGSNPAFVLAGGGNSSVKLGDVLYIKGSGTSLATIKPEDFVRMDRPALDAMMTKSYPEDEKQREAAVLEDMMAAKLPGQEGKRPSVEVLLHELFAQKYVLHVHPALVNGLTCSAGGRNAVLALFPDSVVIESIKPGYILAAECARVIDAYIKANGRRPEVLIALNHGIFFASETPDALEALIFSVMDKLASQVKQPPAVSPVEFDTEKAALLSPVVRMLYKGYTKSTSSVKFLVNADITEFCADEESVAPLMRPFTPDHIVYCRARFLFVKSETDASAQRDALKSAFGEYVAEYGYAPKVVLVQGLGAFVCGSTKKEADTVGALFLDAIAVAVYTRSFGGHLHLTEELESFIVNWEVESYRQKVSFNPSASKRLLEKIAIVTGGAQGFGKGIAEKLIEQGAMVAIADVNIAAAQEVADSMNAGGIKKALAVKCDVTDEESVKNLVYSCVLEFGGLDMFVNNAGIVKAGDLEVMDKRSFELVTSVNYTAYYLCAKYSSRIMKLQHAVAPEEMFDIIEINSKSGLAGSNKNFAYAGSKFGGIGLTQSFAMELAEYNIKVNAICPGNFLDGPLWSDPEKGLFVQYLRSGKVPGAKTVEDVKKSYTDKVPLRRGCTVEDVMCALLYITEQKYETGQAVPVTGGQEMLK